MSKWCHRLLILVAAAGLLLTGQASARDFPFEDPLLATVAGTPGQYQADLPENAPRETLSSANMAFTSDVISNAGFIVRNNIGLGIPTSLTPFAITGFRTTDDETYPATLYVYL
jgi:hypothetical protein